MTAIEQAIKEAVNKGGWTDQHLCVGRYYEAAGTDAGKVLATCRQKPGEGPRRRRNRPEIIAWKQWRTWKALGFRETSTFSAGFSQADRNEPAQYARGDRASGGWRRDWSPLKNHRCAHIDGRRFMPAAVFVCKKSLSRRINPMSAGYRKPHAHPYSPDWPRERGLSLRGLGKFASHANRPNVGLQ
jgi:hypothetical protein